MKHGQIGTIMIVIVLAIIFCSAGIYVIKWVFLPVRTLTTQIDSAGEIIDKTYDSDNAIYNYEWFKTQYERSKLIGTKSIIW